MKQLYIAVIIRVVVTMLDAVSVYTRYRPIIEEVEESVSGRKKWDRNISSHNVTVCNVTTHYTAPVTAIHESKGLSEGDSALLTKRT